MSRVMVVAKSNAERSAESVARKRASGLIQVGLWVPAIHKNDLAQYARRLCDAFAASGGQRAEDVVSDSRAAGVSVVNDDVANNVLAASVAKHQPEDAPVVANNDATPADAPDPRQADIDDILGTASARPAPSPCDATPKPASGKPRRRGPAPAPEAVVRQRIAYGKTVRAAREAKGLMPAELGRRLGYGGINRVERGENFPPPAVRDGIARILGVKP